VQPTPSWPAQRPERRVVARHGSVLEQAVSLIAARHGRCTSDEAFVILLDLAERMDRPVADVAADLLATSRRLPRLVGIG
jgi:hypothetical protein